MIETRNTVEVANAAALAIELAAEINLCHTRFTPEAHTRRVDLINEQFRLLADALGYTVAPKTDALNTGKPIVAGGV